MEYLHGDFLRDDSFAFSRSRCPPRRWSGNTTLIITMVIMEITFSNTNGIRPRRPRRRENSQREQRNVALLREPDLGGGRADGGAEGAVEGADGDFEIDDSGVGVEDVG